tara:strand:- start:831 stop:968 length:138 start_codon:yes stop_codon:yes gene_type:complete
MDDEDGIGAEQTGIHSIFDGHDELSWEESGDDGIERCGCEDGLQV